MNRRRLRERGQGKVLGIVALLLLLAGGGGAYWFIAMRSTPEKTVQRYQDASKAGDQDALMATMCEQSKKLLAGAPAAAGAIGKMPGAKAGDVQIEIGTATVTADKAEVPVTYKLGGEAAKGAGGMNSMTMPMALVKEGGEWKIDLMATTQAMFKNLKGMMPNGPPPGMPQH